MRRLCAGFFLLLLGIVHPGTVLGLRCSGGIDTGEDCLADSDCAGGVCVVTGGVCDGGPDDGTNCATTCTEQHPCEPAYRICRAGSNAGGYCLRNSHCGGNTCDTTGMRCTGGNFDRAPCAEGVDCPGGACAGVVATPTATLAATTTPTIEVSATPTQTAPPTLTRTPTRTPTLTPLPVVFTIATAVGGPDGVLSIPVSIRTNNRPVVATANDITFDRSVLTLAPESCRINPALGKVLRASVAQDSGSLRTIRVLVQATQNVDPIPTGLLYTCSVRIAPSALPGRYTLRSDLTLAYDATGTALAFVSGDNGALTVSLIGASCGGDCNADGEVTIDEIVGGVGIALGAGSVESCLAIDLSADGEVTVDEIILAVTNALNGCLITPTPAPTATATATPLPITLYVRSSGNDEAGGISPSTALKTIGRATAQAPTGYRIVVGPGIYAESVVTSTSGGAPQDLQFFADVTGSLTGDTAGDVVIDAATSGIGVGIRLSNSAGTVIDGFTIINAADAGISIRAGSDAVTVRNCVIHDGSGAGIRVQDSSDVLIFNNLIHNNGAQGIAIVGNGAGSPGARIFSNTVVGNGDRGITIGTSNVTSPNALVRNNILQDNGGRTAPPLENIKVFTQPASVDGYSGDYNLVFPSTYLPSTIAGIHDVNVDAELEFAAGDDFRLRPDSPAIDAGDILPRFLETLLHERATTANGVDGGRLDLGFHFLP